MDDYRRLEIHGRPGKGWSAPTADKGHLAELVAFASGVREGRWPISIEDQIAATRVSFHVEKALRAIGGAAGAVA
jgi:hypothetical protein